TLNVLSPAQKVKFEIINLSGKSLRQFTLANPPLLIPDSPSCMMSANGRYLLTITNNVQQQQKSRCTATVWHLKVADNQTTRVIFFCRITKAWVCLHSRDCVFS